MNVMVNITEHVLMFAFSVENSCVKCSSANTVYSFGLYLTNVLCLQVVELQILAILINIDTLIRYGNSLFDSLGFWTDLDVNFSNLFELTYIETCSNNFLPLLVNVILYISFISYVEFMACLYTSNTFQQETFRTLSYLAAFYLDL